MHINIPSSIISAALKGVIESLEKSEDRALDTTIGDIFIDKEPDSGLYEADINKTFYVTVVSGKYYMNGYRHENIQLMKGNRYIFLQQAESNVSHNMAFSTTRDGTHNGGVAYTTGVELIGEVGTREHKLVLNTSEDTPLLYYYCVNHAGMGGSIDFVSMNRSGEREEPSEEESSTEDMIIRQEDKFGTKKEAYDALPESTKKVIDTKAREHNEEVGSDRSKRTTAPTLAMVYWRGIGAYNTNPESVRPTVTSAEQWAIARVNSYLYALRNGRFRSGKHDTDLLPRDHPMSSKGEESRSRLRLRGLLDPENQLSPNELDMLITQLTSIKINAETIKMILEEFGHMPAWGESKINSISDTLAKLESYMLADLSEDLERAVGDVDPTNFPKSGDDMKVSLRNSEYPLFDRDFAEMIKNDYPSIWDRGGNVLGNKQYTRLTKILDQGGSIETSTDEEAVRLREAWAARHKQDFRMAGTIAQIKWLVIGNRGESYMKNLVREEISKIENATRSKGLSMKKQIEFRCVSSTNHESGNVTYNLNGSERIHLGIKDIDVRAYDEEDKEMDIEESLRAINGRGRPAKYYSIEGIASSTSIDSYGTEMSYSALLEMQGQMQMGVPLLPRHTSRSNGDLAEWDEVIGRTYEAELKQDDVVMPAERGDRQYSLLVRSRLYGEDAIARELVKRLRRGEPIGQSIGGWFNDMEVITNSDDEIERVIIKSVTLDHLAITRAPANPDSVGLATYSKNSKELHTIISTWRSSMKPTEKPNLEEPTEKEETSEVSDLPLSDDKKELSKESDVIQQTKLPENQLNKDQSEVEKRHIAEINETEDQYMITFEKNMSDRMAHEEDMKQKMEEYMDHEMKEKMKEYMDHEEMQEYMKEVFEKKMEEFMKDLMEQNKMEFDDLANERTEEKEEAETRDLDSSAVVVEPVMNDVEVEGGPAEEVPAVDELTNSPFDHLQNFSVMPFNDDMPLAAEDVPWGWDTTAQDEVLGEGLDNWNRYAMAHVYRDAEANPETKGAYKLPIAKMVNGELRVVLNGVRAAMAALNGARGGVDVPEEEREQIHNVLSQYYSKFGEEAPELRNKEEEIKKSDTTIEKSVILQSETIKEESSMNNEDMKTLAELIGRSIEAGLKPLSDRIDNIESRAQSTMNEAPVKEVEKATIETVIPKEVEELRAIIEKQNEIIESALSEPQRVGLHPGQLHRGIGATSAIESLVERSSKEGYVGLSAIVKRNVDVISEETEMSKLSVHKIKELLSAGLNAAEKDGLIG